MPRHVRSGRRPMGSKAHHFCIRIAYLPMHQSLCTGQYRVFEFRSLGRSGLRHPHARSPKARAKDNSTINNKQIPPPPEGGYKAASRRKPETMERHQLGLARISSGVRLTTEPTSLGYSAD
jgi:hypothetical protein